MKVTAHKTSVIHEGRFYEIGASFEVADEEAAKRLIDRGTVVEVSKNHPPEEDEEEEIEEEDAATGTKRKVRRKKHK